MKNTAPVSRRTFVGFGLATVALHHIPVRAESPNEKLSMGIIGSGGRGRANLGGVRSQHIHTLCDVNGATLTALKEKYPDTPTTTDWREVVNNDEIDAVVISTADHHHAPAAITAMRAGKHVYCEKPLAHTVQEARWMQDEYNKRKGQIATQMGTQIHAGNNYRRSVELIQAGAVGSVRGARMVQPRHRPGG